MLRWCALALVSACYQHDPDASCTVRCDDDGRCPSGLSCGDDLVCKTAGEPDCSGGGAFLPGFRHRRAIKVTPPSTTTLPGYVVAVVLAGDVPLSQASLDGIGVAFTAADGLTKLDFELEKADLAVGDVAAWVRIPMLAGSQRIYFYYGGPASLSNPRATWDAGFAAVWHLSGTVQPKAPDSTQFGHDLVQATLAQQPAIKPGLVGDGRAFAGGQDLDTDSVGNLRPGSASFSYSLWINTNSTPVGVFEQSPFYSGGRSGSDAGFDILRTENEWRADFSDGTHVLASAAFTTTTDELVGDWRFLAVTVDRQTSMFTVFVDGTVRNATDIAGYLEPDHLGNFSIGSGNGVAFYEGLIDEVRRYSYALDPAWLEAEYANLTKPASFVAFGPDEPAP